MPQSGSSSTGAIAGGVVGGVVGAALIGLLAFLLVRMARKRAATSQPDIDNPWALPEVGHSAWTV